ncbi:MAG: hypothetical protein ACF8PN_08060 [Phycisphaerales bacterium]
MTPGPEYLYVMAYDPGAEQGQWRNAEIDADLEAGLTDDTRTVYRTFLVEQMVRDIAGTNPELLDHGRWKCRTVRSMLFDSVDG